MKHNGDWLLREQMDTNDLSEQSRQKLVGYLCEFTQTLFGDTKKHQKLLTATAAVQVFKRCSLVNFKYSQMCKFGYLIMIFCAFLALVGFMEHRIKYTKKKTKKLIGEAAETNQSIVLDGVDGDESKKNRRK